MAGRLQTPLARACIEQTIDLDQADGFANRHAARLGVSGQRLFARALARSKLAPDNSLAERIGDGREERRHPFGRRVRLMGRSQGASLRLGEGHLPFEGIVDDIR